MHRYLFVICTAILPLSASTVWQGLTDIPQTRQNKFYFKEIKARLHHLGIRDIKDVNDNTPFVKALKKGYDPINDVEPELLPLILSYIVSSPNYKTFCKQLNENTEDNTEANTLIKERHNDFQEWQEASHEINRIFSEPLETLWKKVRDYDNTFYIKRTTSSSYPSHTAFYLSLFSAGSLFGWIVSKIRPKKKTSST